MNVVQQRRQALRLIIVGLAVCVLGAGMILLAILLTSGRASANGVPSAGSEPSGRASIDGVPSAGWKPGDRCTAGTATRTRGGVTYECVQKAWDDCPRWHAVKPADYTPPTGWSRPPQRPCAPVCSPSPTALATTPAVVPSRSVAAPAALPVTGQSGSVLLLVPLGLVAVVAGSVLRFSRRARRSAG